MSVEPVGRERELARVGELLAGVRAGESAALVIEGAPGAGKTTLLEAAIARAGGLRVLRATGVEIERHLAYAGVAELLAPILDLRETVPAPQRRALERALAMRDDGPSDRFAVGAGVVSLLAAAAEAAPVLCAVDDVQWRVDASVSVLRFAARRLGNEGVVLLLGARRDGDATVDLRPLPSLELLPLDDDAAARVVRGAAASEVEPCVMARILAIGAGNPLTLLEVTAALTTAQLRGDVSPEEPLQPGQSAAALIAHRLDALDERSRSALTVAALGGPGVRLADLEPAEDAGLLRVEAGRVRFRHPLERHDCRGGRRSRAGRRAHGRVGRGSDAVAAGGRAGRAGEGRARRRRPAARRAGPHAAGAPRGPRRGRHGRGPGGRGRRPYVPSTRATWRRSAARARWPTSTDCTSAACRRGSSGSPCICTTCSGSRTDCWS